MAMYVLAVYTEIIERTEDNYVGLERPIVIAYYRFASKSTSKMTTYWRNRMKIISNDHKDLIFAVSDADQFNHQLIEYGFHFN